ncbi:hypothetical protein FQR65_LT19202 [Abscondita terminalis]|nr:hypothetical protein FQR65_LT19202 [Abscondita terminalis]
MDDDTQSIIFDDEKNEKNDIRNVPKGVLKEFIEVYRANPALWQIKNKTLYNNRNLKTRGYSALVSVWKKYDPDADQKTVKLKIQSLRGSYRKELKKVEKSQRSGRGVEEIYKSHLWYFNLMDFLNDHELPTNSIDNIEAAAPSTNASDVTVELGDLDEEQENNEAEVNEPTSTKKSSYMQKNHLPTTEDGSHKKHKLNEERERRLFITTCTEALQSKVSDTEALGQYISTKLAKVTHPEQRMYAEALLTKVLNKAIMNKLTEFTDLSTTSPRQFSESYISYDNSAQSHSSSIHTYASPVASPPLQTFSTYSENRTENLSSDMDSQQTSHAISQYYNTINENDM